jgi:hypothetical protein
MADKKISALTGATTPLAGTEVLPIVQSGTTVKVATNDLTVRNFRANATTGILQVTGPAASSTRVVTVPDANFTAARTDAAQSFTGDQTLSTGNLVVSNGKGIDFSATPGTGTSELLADYEEGDFTPTIVGSTSAGVGTYVYQLGKYTKIGREVSFELLLVWTAHTGVGNMYVAGLPFSNGYYSPPVGIVCYNMVFLGQLAGYVNGTNIDLLQLFTGAAYTAVAMDTAVTELRISGTYSV